MCLPPACFQTGFGLVAGFEEGLSRNFSKKSKLTVISDDSGLSINCLSGNPGIYSARWAKKYGSFKKAMQKILAMISDAKLKKNNKIIKAKFVCSLSYKKYGKKAINVNGIIYGRISNKIIGTNGFGYDPIFIPNGFSKTFGEMAKRKKMNKIKQTKKFMRIL